MFTYNIYLEIYILCDHIFKNISYDMPPASWRPGKPMTSLGLSLRPGDQER